MLAPGVGIGGRYSVENVNSKQLELGDDEELGGGGDEGLLSSFERLQKKDRENSAKRMVRGLGENQEFAKSTSRVLSGIINSGRRE